MRFFNEISEFVFEDPAQYPAPRPVRLQQIIDRTAANTIHVETYSVPVRSRTLNFQAMSLTDYQGLLDWYTNQVNGMAEIFSFEDERGVVFQVRFTNPDLNFPEVSFERFNGSVELEIVG